MSATTYDALFDLRGQLENSLAAGLAEDLKTYTRSTGADFQKARARFELALQIGAPLGHKKILTPTDRRHDMFNFALGVTVISAPPPGLKRNEGESDADFALREKANANYHAQLVAHVAA